MKTNEMSGKKVLGLSTRAGLLLVVVAIITLEATGLIQYYFSQRGIKQEASLRAQSELKSAQNEIMGIVDQAEGAVRNSLWIAEWCLDNPDSLVRVPQRVVDNNPVVVGSTIALMPEYSEKYPLYAPYATRDPENGELQTLSLATDDYDYPSQEWFIKPLEFQDGYWSEPYYDEGGGNMLMTTFSMPVKDRNGKVAAILTADISLDWLTELMGSIKVYPNAFNTVVSRSGQIMVCPNESLVMSKSVDQFADESDDSDVLRSINEAMLSGQEGELAIRYHGEGYRIYFAPVERTGWSLSIVVPERDMFAGVRKVGGIVIILQLLGVAMIIVILRVTIRNQMKYKHLSTQKELIQNELRIGHDIQMSMIPKTFPAFPNRTDLDFAATIIPAKEVGGDLYDFYIRDEKLFFCIGDVSGKGVPAALVMSVTQSLFRATSAHEINPSKIVTSINNLMSENNENSMFVTFFCGILDLATGVLRYCNAGHNPPMLNTDKLPVITNIPLGVMPGMSFKEQETRLKYDDTLFLYTDGLTEAENASAEQFGEERMGAVLGTKRNAVALLDAMQKAVNDFVKAAPQSDDLTVLVIHYLTHPASTQQERHLILHNDIQQIPQLAEFVETIAEEKQLSQSLAMSLNLALEEAVTNVILYAYPVGADGLVDVEAILREHSLEFIITDSGVPFDPTTVPDVDITLPADERPVGGLGIYLVRQMMDELHYQRIGDKNVLSMTKNI
jgi:sigma-B regulation protein RsbU (phosphoserine phosphatase)